MIRLRALSFVVVVQLTVLAVIPWWLVSTGRRVSMGYHVFVRYYEEPHLQRVFGPSYAEYCAAVPRWWPRLTPWR